MKSNFLHRQIKYNSALSSTAEKTRSAFVLLYFIVLTLQPCISCDRFVSILGRLFNIKWCVCVCLSVRKIRWLWQTNMHVAYFIYNILYAWISFNNFITVTVSVFFIRFSLKIFQHTRNRVYLSNVFISLTLGFLGDICKCR